MMIWLSVATLIIVSCKCSYANPNNTDLSANAGNAGIDPADTDRVELRVYYECMCPHCRRFFKDDLVPLQEKLGPYVKLVLIPYGKAQSYDVHGEVKFSCQHGPTECYGNKFHACAIQELKDVHKYLIFNACLMDMSRPGNGSDDNAAMLCGQQQNVEAEPIITCAKSSDGSNALYAYGKATHRVTIKHVPHITVNGELLSEGDDVFKVVCKAFKNAPAACEG